MDPSPRTFYIADVQYRPDWRKVAIDLVGRDLSQQVVRLVGEPSNQYDRYAVKVLVNGTHLGYIPKPMNIDIWALKDLGYKPEAALVKFDGAAAPYDMFQIKVTFTAPVTKP